MSKTLSEYIAGFEYCDKISLALSTTIGDVCNVSFDTFIGALVKITSVSLILAFSMTNGITIKLLKTMKKVSWRKTVKEWELIKLLKKVNELIKIQKT